MRTIPLRIAAASTAWLSLWFTPDQLGQRFLQRGEPQQAAEAFQDPMWQGTAWFRAGEFAKAEQAFARATTPDAEFNRGNCLVMLGRYEAAVQRYDQALQLRPDWSDAQVNRQIAAARAKLLERRGEDRGDQQLGADDITFEKRPNREGQDTEVQGEAPLTDAAMQSMWLRRVQTKPAEFLKVKFAYQLAAEREEAAP